ncbi:NAD(P)H-binding protein [Nocardiopsis sp. RV163]|uniref:NmrA family NAD(P)-binding protein n=1 Tax=Nocardiopsis sp. RV163 TaxID=1661388 RepID=UPI002E0F1687
MERLTRTGLTRGMAEMTTQSTFLVTAGRGTTGRRVVRILREQGFTVRAASRSSEQYFDWLDQSSWGPALKGVDAVYLVPFDPEPLTPVFVRSAVEAGVRRIVLLSGRGVDVPDYGGEGNDAVAHHLAGEEAVRASGVEWTIVRPGWFAQNFSEGFLRGDVLSGELRLSAADVPASFVDAEDIAAVVAAALTGADHSGQVYELSGPRSLTMGEVASEISGGTGRDVRYVPLPPEEFVAELIRQGYAEEDARSFERTLSPIRLGLDSHLSDGVRRALGRGPRDFTDFVRDAETSGAWDN